MLFSIIIPVYNVEKYLHQCVDSVLCQTFRDFELILVDDGSPDSCPIICDSYAKQDFRVQVIHQQNAGQAAARNAGTQIAQGMYILYIDSDDYIQRSDFLLQLSERAEGLPDFICYKFCKLNDATGVLSPSPFSIPVFSNEESSYPYRLMKLIEADAFYCAPWCKIIRRDLLNEHNITFQPGLLSEDQDWFYKIATVAKTVETIDTSFIAYRQRPGSTSRSWGTKNVNDTLNILNKWKSTFETSPESPVYRELLHSLAKLYCNLLIGFCAYDKSDRHGHIERLQQLVVLLRYDKNPRVKKISLIYRIVGFRLLLFIIGLAGKIKG